MRNPVFLPYVNNKGADQPAEIQPAHLCSLISAFGVRCLDSIMSPVFMTLACFCSEAERFQSYLVENPEDRFSRDEAH